MASSRPPVLRLDRIRSTMLEPRRTFETQALRRGHLVSLTLIGVSPVKREAIIHDVLRAASATFGAPGQTTTVSRGYRDDRIELRVITDPAAPFDRRAFVERLRSFIVSQGLRPRMIRAIDFLVEDAIGEHPIGLPSHAALMDTRAKAEAHIAALRRVWAFELGAELVGEPARSDVHHPQTLLDIHLATDPLTLRILHGFLTQKRSPINRATVLAGVAILRGQYRPAEIAAVIAALEADGWIERPITTTVGGTSAFAGPMTRRISPADLLAI